MMMRRARRGAAWLLPAAAVLMWAVACGTEAWAERRGIAVIIGNGVYEDKDIPPVDYAHRDAEAFRRYVVDVLGYAEEDVIYLKDATRVEMRRALGGPRMKMNDVQARLNLLGGKDKEVVVYYSGHGVPGGDRGQPYLLPVDVPSYEARDGGYGVGVLYESLEKLEGVMSVRVFLDTCFSGSSEGGRLVAGSPVYTDVQVPEGGPGMMVLTAVTRTQIATWDREARHGLFTHHLLDALYGKGDTDRDGQVTAAEAKAYLDRHMTSAAWLSNRREQHATLQGVGDEVLASTGADGAFAARPRLQDAEAPAPRKREPRAVDHAAVEAALGLDREARLLIQLALASLKFDPGPADGAFGPRTRGAIRSWQEAKGYEATDYLTGDQAETLKAVGKAVRARAEGERKAREAALREARLAREAAEAARREREAKAAAEAERLAREVTRPGREFRDCGGCPEMVVVPAGSYWMGAPAGEVEGDADEGPRHEVRIGRPLAVGKYEVTFGEWDACVADGGCGVHRPSDEGWGRGRRPVINVSWEDAKAYVRWLSRKTGQGYRLLSEAEWEYVARAGTSTRYWWGDDVGGSKANCVRCGSRWDRERTVPVGSFGKNGFGLYDVHGNVWEWVEDCWHGNYAGAPTDGSAWATEGSCPRVLRGGSWDSFPGNLRSANRFKIRAGFRDNSVGFRVARTLTP